MARDLDLVGAVIFDQLAPSNTRDDLAHHVSHRALVARRAGAQALRHPREPRLELGLRSLAALFDAGSEPADVLAPSIDRSPT